MLLGFPESRGQARALAHTLGLLYGDVKLHRFPDGESRLRLPTDVASHVFVYRSLDRPNDKLVELLLTARDLRHRGATRLSLIAPYLCYMRQDKEFSPGEVVSQKVVGAFLAELFDDVVTVDPHLHRVRTLAEAVPAKHAIALTATEAFADYLQGDVRRPILVGPDEESEQWVASIATRCGLEYAVARKKREGDREVRVTLPQRDFSGRSVVLVDDVASTGETLMAAAAGLRAGGAVSVDVLVTHALFISDAEEAMRGAGIDRIGSSDSIPHSTNVVTLKTLLAPCASRLMAATGASAR